MLRLQKTIGNLSIQRLLKSAAPRTELAIGRRVGGLKLTRALEVTRTARRDAAEQAHCGSESLLQRSEGEGGVATSAGGGITVIIIAAGFDQTGSDEQLAEQLHGSGRIHWSPVTKDFERTARDTQSSNIYGARTDDEFFGALQASPRSHRANRIHRPWSKRCSRFIAVRRNSQRRFGFSLAGEHRSADQAEASPPVPSSIVLREAEGM
jgi:hypothetical protein